MVDAVAAPFTFANKTALFLPQGNSYPDSDSLRASFPETVLIPEIVEEQEFTAGEATPGYDRLGRMNRNTTKGLFVDSYR